MSCLSLSELDMSQQTRVVKSFSAAIERRYTDQNIEQRYRALLSRLVSPTVQPVTPSASPSTSGDTDSLAEVAAGSPQSALPAAIPATLFPLLSTAECTAMVEQAQKFIPIRTCGCGRHAVIYQRRGNRAVRYFAECAPCEIKTMNVATPQDAAAEWDRGTTFAIHVTRTSTAPALRAA